MSTAPFREYDAAAILLGRCSCQYCRLKRLEAFDAGWRGLADQMALGQKSAELSKPTEAEVEAWQEAKQ